MYIIKPLIKKYIGIRYTYALCNTMSAPLKRLNNSGKNKLIGCSKYKDVKPLNLN